jgi:hypothetical protein
VSGGIPGQPFIGQSLAIFYGAGRVADGKVGVEWRGVSGLARLQDQRHGRRTVHHGD